MRTPVTHGCRSIGCATQVAAFALFCDACLALVPTSLANDITVTRRRYQKHGRPADAKAYLDAVNAAADHIRAARVKAVRA